MTVSTYIILSRDKDENLHQDYIQALNAKQAVEFVYGNSLDDIEIVEVAKVLKDWKRA